jgi:hypothetical protein
MYLRASELCTGYSNPRSIAPMAVTCSKAIFDSYVECFICLTVEGTMDPLFCFPKTPISEGAPPVKNKVEVDSNQPINHWDE